MVPIGFALIVVAVIGGQPKVIPLGPYPTLKSCQEAKAEMKTVPVPDDIMAVGMECVELVPNVKS